MANMNWAEAIKPLLKKYKGKKHPLEYKNIYQLMIMVVLSAQDSDAHINKITPPFFDDFPNMQSLAKASPAALSKHLSGVRNNANKIKWLSEIAATVKKDSNIPLTIETLTELPGIGRKSANVIMREAGVEVEGIMIDLHVVRVAPRLGIAKGTDPKKIEKQLMEILPKSEWDAGMAMSFHGREICRPQPKCEICFMRDVCEYYQTVVAENKA